jgi:hypothetical protein
LPYCIYTVACRYGISGILMQRQWRENLHSLDRLPSAIYSRTQIFSLWIRASRCCLRSAKILTLCLRPACHSLLR